MTKADFTGISRGFRDSLRHEDYRAAHTLLHEWNKAFRIVVNAQQGRSRHQILPAWLAEAVHRNYLLLTGYNSWVLRLLCQVLRVTEDSRLEGIARGLGAGFLYADKSGDILPGPRVPAPPEDLYVERFLEDLVWDRDFGMTSSGRLWGWTEEQRRTVHE